MTGVINACREKKKAVSMLRSAGVLYLAGIPSRACVHELLAGAM